MSEQKQKIYSTEFKESFKKLVKLYGFSKDMIKFEQIKDESEEGFRRLTGIKRTTFGIMLGITGFY